MRISRTVLEGAHQHSVHENEGLGTCTSESPACSQLAGEALAQSRTSTDRQMKAAVVRKRPGPQRVPVLRLSRLRLSALTHSSSLYSPTSSSIPVPRLLLHPLLITPLRALHLWKTILKVSTRHCPRRLSMRPRVVPVTFQLYKQSP